MVRCSTVSSSKDWQTQRLHLIRGGRDQLLAALSIRVDRTGICGTDLHIYKWDESSQRTIPVPMVVGHEFVGEVVEVGSNVKDFFPG